MPAFFNVDEIFEIAVDIERNGEEFYRSSAALASEPGKDQVNSIINEEKKHIIQLSDMKNKLAQGGDE